MERKTLEVKTQFGTLCAEIGDDPQKCLGVIIYLRTDNQTEVNLCAVATEAGSDNMSAFLWANSETDGLILKHLWTREELIKED